MVLSSTWFSDCWLSQSFVYPHAHVALEFFRVLAWDGEPHGHDGQAFVGRRRAARTVAPLLPANTRVLSALALPPCTASRARGRRRGALPRPRRRGVRGGLRLVQVREKAWPPRAATRSPRGCGARCAARREAAAQRRRATTRAALGLAGVHWTAQRLAAARTRPTDLMVGPSCHTRDDLARAADLGVDFAVLGPVRRRPRIRTPRARLDGFAARSPARAFPSMRSAASRRAISRRR